MSSPMMNRIFGLPAAACAVAVQGASAMTTTLAHIKFRKRIRRLLTIGGRNVGRGSADNAELQNSCDCQRNELRATNTVDLGPRVPARRRSTRSFLPIVRDRAQLLCI